MTYTATRRAGYLGCIVQSIVNNLAPILFIIFRTQYGFSYERLAMIVVINFITQIMVEALSIRLVEKLGYRILIVIAHALAGSGLVLLGILPLLMGSAYVGLVIAMITGAFGSGLLEAILSPVMNALPAPRNQKASAMSFLHSFYSWGQASVVLITTLLLRASGGGNWWILPVLWSVIPFVNMLIFMSVPFPKMDSPEKRTGFKDLLLSPGYIMMVALIVCSGSSEMTVSQWSSLFVEQSLGLSKMWGDIAGPCAFALMMGAGRVIYSIIGGRIRHNVYMAASALLCVICYLLIALSAHPALSLVGCAVSGLAVSVMWPGTLSFAAARFPNGGALIFGTLAMAGNIGCSVGPWFAGIIADHSDSGLNAGILGAVIFPCTMFLLLLITGLRKKA